MIKIANYINGEMIAPQSGAYIDNYEPATGLVYSHCPDSDETDVQAAVEAAQAAFEGWANMPITERSKILLRLSQLMEDNLDKLAEAESQDQGKPVWLAQKGEIPRAV